MVLVYVQVNGLGVDYICDITQSCKKTKILRIWGYGLRQRSRDRRGGMIIRDASVVGMGRRTQRLRGGYAFSWSAIEFVCEEPAQRHDKHHREFDIE